MKTTIKYPRGAANAGAWLSRSGCGRELHKGFSLIEVIVAVSLLSIMILGLVAMFDQTRKAFTGSFTQVDVLESGRCAADILTRDFEQMAAAGQSVVNFNFVAKSSQIENNSTLLVQALTDTNEYRTNVFYEVAFLTRDNSAYKKLDSVGYRVDYANGNGVGSLYRYEQDLVRTTNTPKTPSIVVPNGAWCQFQIVETNSLTDPRWSKLIDGVVHFKVRAYDSNGVPFGYSYTNGNYYAPYNTYGPLPAANYTYNYYNYYNTSNYSASGLSQDFAYFFRSNALPSYVELELGVLEDRALKRFNSMSNSPSLATAYLSNHVGAVHIFRQRIPIRAAANATFQ